MIRSNTTMILALTVGAMLSVGSAAEARSDIEELQRALRPYLAASPEKPRKGLCVCANAIGPGLKRVGFINSGFIGAGGNLRNVAVNCEIPAYDDATGELVPNMGPPTTCADWFPLAK